MVHDSIVTQNGIAPPRSDMLPASPQSDRRAFLADVGMGFTGLALGAMLCKDGAARAESPVLRASGSSKPKAKSVIWLFMVGCASPLERFDAKPELNKHAGKTITESPYKTTLESPYLKENVREVIAGLHKVHPKIFPMQIGYQKRGKSGLEMSDWWPHLGGCADDLALVR